MMFEPLSRSLDVPTNRISHLFASSRPSTGAPRRSRAFTEVPTALLPAENHAVAQQIYQLAYEQARAQTRADELGDLLALPRM